MSPHAPHKPAVRQDDRHLSAREQANGLVTMLQQRFKRHPAAPPPPPVCHRDLGATPFKPLRTRGERMVGLMKLTAAPPRA